MLIKYIYLYLYIVFTLYLNLFSFNIEDNSNEIKIDINNNNQISNEEEDIWPIDRESTIKWFLSKNKKRSIQNDIKDAFLGIENGIELISELKDNSNPINNSKIKDLLGILLYNLYKSQDEQKGHIEKENKKTTTKSTVIQSIFTSITITGFITIYLLTHYIK